MADAVIVGDVHLSDHAPSSRRNTYATEILDKIAFCSTKARELGVPLVFAGDIFHLKAPTRNSHWLVQATHEALQGVRTFIVPGNHDMQGDRLSTLKKQPLGVLARMDGVSLLIGEDSDLPGIAGVPYITEFDGGNWQHALAETWHDFGIVAKKPTLLVTHAPLFPPGQAPGVYASILPDEWANYWIGIAATYYGHIHDCHSTYASPNGLMEFCNQGALSRGSLHESSLTRKPAITLWSGGSFSRIEVPHLPPSEVFLFEEAERVASNKASAAEFAEALGSTKVSGLTLETVIDVLRSRTTDKQVLNVIEEVLEAVQ